VNEAIDGRRDTVVGIGQKRTFGHIVQVQVETPLLGVALRFESPVSRPRFNETAAA
jgi:hypothetical protein